MRNLPQKLGARIRHFRILAKMPQTELAMRARFAKSYLSDVERGKVNISILSLDRIAENLNVPLAVLLDCDEAPETEQILEALGRLPSDALLALSRVGLMMAGREDVPEQERPKG